MAKGGSMIPLANNDGSALVGEELVDALDSIEEEMSSFFGAEKKKSNKEEQRAKKNTQQLEYLKQLHNFGRLTDIEYNQAKRNLKINKYLEKFLVKGKFLQKVGGFLKSIASSVGNSFFKFLKALFLLALLDPNGSLLKSLFGILSSVLTMALKFIIQVLPGVIKTMWKLFWDIIVPGFGKFGKIIGDQLFGVGSAMSSVLETFGKFIPIAFVLIGIWVKFGKAIMFVGKAVGWVGKKIFAQVIKSISAYVMANAAQAIYIATIMAAVIAIAAIVAVFVLLWKYSDKVVGFFESIFKWVMKLGTTGKIIVGALVTVFAVLFTPLTAIIAAIYGLAKLFQSIKKIGLKNTFILIGKSIFAFGKKMWGKIKGVFKGVFTDIAKWGINLHKKIIGFFTDIAQWGIELNSKIITWIKNLPKKIIGFFTNIAKWGMELNSKIGKWFSDLFTGIAKWGIELNSKIGKWFSDIWNDITSFFTDIARWGMKLNSKLITWIKNLPKMAWDGLKRLGTFLWEFTVKSANSFVKFLLGIAKSIKKGVVKIGTYLWDKAKSIGSSIVMSVVGPIIKVFKWLGKSLQPVFEALSPVLKTVGEVLGWIWDKVLSPMVNVFKTVYNLIKGIINWFKTVARRGFSYFMASSEKKAAYTKVTKIKSEIEDLAEDDKKFKAFKDSGKNKKLVTLVEKFKAAKGDDKKEEKFLETLDKMANDKEQIKKLDGILKVLTNANEGKGRGPITPGKSTRTSKKRSGK